MTAEQTDIPGDQTALQAAGNTRFVRFCCAISVVAFGLLVAFGRDIWGPLAGLLPSYGIGAIGLTLALLCGRLILLRVVGRDGTNPDDPMRWYRDHIAALRHRDILAAAGALIVTVSCFTVHKSIVVGDGGYHFDAMFIEWDRMLFAGQDPWRLTHAIAPSATATWWIDFLYHPAFLPMLIGYLVCITAQGRPALRYTYMTAFLASYVVIGMLLANAFHSAGPVYDGILFGDGTTFAPLMARLETLSDEAGPFSFLVLQSYLLTLKQEGTIGFGGGISAMPSMHIVLAFLWTFAAWHLNRVLGVILTIYAIVIWFGSVHLGWHYFVDGLVGLAVLAVLWRAAGRYYGLYGTSR